MTEHSHRLVSRLEDGIEELEIAFSKAYWDSQIEATPENDRRRLELEIRLRKLKGDPAALQQVEAALAEPLHEPILRRQLEVLRLSLTGNQMSDAEREQVVELSTAVESDFASHRALVRGERFSENEIEEILKTSDDADFRRLVWTASKRVGAVVAERVRELVRVRNSAARNLGFADYYQMELELQELSESWLFRVMGDLERLTEEPFRRWKSGLDADLADRFGTTELHPWHYADPFFQLLPPDGAVSLDAPLAEISAAEIARRTFDTWGIDLTKVLELSDLYPRERKCQHAFCLSVDRREDVRILANVVPGERWIEVMLHESGHAAYDVAIDRHLPYLLRRPAHTFVTEAMAILSGRLVRDTTWLTDIAGLDAGTIEKQKVELDRATAAESLLFTRWGLVMVHFERDLYADPERDLDELWWDLVERFQLVSRPPEISDGGWASKIHLAVAPVYYHNYLLGEMLASQLAATAQERHGGLVGSADAGRFLEGKVFRPGASQRWDGLIEAATGGPLGAADFARYLAAAAAPAR
ncbi:MAG: M2 family metallopeptidase [Actinomycetota bacterium]